MTATIDRQKLISVGKAVHAKGGAVVPIVRKGIKRKDGTLTNGKCPLVPGWSTRKLGWDELEKKLRESQTVGLGIITGLCTGELATLAVLDFDGVGWGAAFENMLHCWDKLGSSVGIDTGSGRKHKWIKLLNAPTKAVFTNRTFQRPDQGAAIELRVNASNNVFYGLHPSGGFANWENGESEIIALEFAELYDWLTDWNNLCPRGFEYGEQGKEQAHKHLEKWGKKSKTASKKRKGVVPPNGRDAHVDVVAYFEENGIEFVKAEKQGFTFYNIVGDCLTGDHADDGRYGFQVFENGNVIYTCPHSTCQDESKGGGYDVMGMLDLYTKAENEKSAQHLTSRDYHALFEKWGYDVKLNLCNDDVTVNGEILTDQVEAGIRQRVRDYAIENYKKASVGATEDSVRTLASERCYHPVKDYFDSLAWDGKDHIGDLLSYFTHDGFLERWLEAWLPGAVARVYDGWQNPMLVLDGAQGLGKSYLAKWLCGPLSGMYIEAPIIPEYKDHRLRLIELFIWEVQELGATTRKADQDALKAFITLGTVRERKSYGRRDIQKPVICSFIGTTNPGDGFLTDLSGNRRYLVTHLDSIDWGYSKAVDVDQLWAQVVALYRKDDTWKLTKDDKDASEEQNTKYMVSDPVEVFLEEAYKFTGDPNDFVSTAVVLNVMHNSYNLPPTKAIAMRVSTVLKSWGAQKVRLTLRGEQVRGYVGIVSK